MDLTIVLLLATVCLAQDDSKFFNKNIPDQEDTLRAEDFEKAKYVLPSETSTKKKAEYRPDLFEGDIKNPGLNSKTIGYFMNQEKSADGLLRNAIKNRYQLWANKRIPYTISTQYSSYSRSRIASAMQEYATQTCIQFVPKSGSDSNYLHIMPDDGCYSTVGKEGGKQILSLGSGCVVKGIIIHELMHAVGFFHEQGRNDRDSYVDIMWSNIIPGMEDQFQKYSLYTIDHLGASYDYGSIMHYEKDAFSRNDAPTIVPKQAGVEIGQRRGFSGTDTYKIKKLYQCDGGVTPSPPNPTPAPGCTDIRSDCPYLNNQGWCTAAVDFMKTQCPKTCKFCTPDGGGSCTDKRTDCSYLQTHNYCTLAQPFMKENCAKTCNMCSSGGGPGPNNCKDTLEASQCSYYSKILSCSSNQLLRQYCPKSCNSC